MTTKFDKNQKRHESSAPIATCRTKSIRQYISHLLSQEASEGKRRVLAVVVASSVDVRNIELYGAVVVGRNQAVRGRAKGIQLRQIST